MTQAQTATVKAKLTDGTGSVYRQGFLHFELQNCGSNFPVVAGNSLTVVKTSFDMKPTQVDGTILGQILGNDQIMCGNVASTFYVVTPMKDAATPLAPVGGQKYFICSSLAPSQAQCSNPGGGIWNPSTSQPMTITPVTPGFTILFGNPIQTQIWKQPNGTSAKFFGTFDFTGATVLGIGGGGGGGGSNIKVNGVALGGGIGANFNNLLPAHQTGFLSCNFQLDGSGNISLQCPWGNSSSTFARGDLAVQFDAFGNLVVPNNLQAATIQTTSAGGWNVLGSFGAMTPAGPNQSRLGFSTNGILSVSENGGQVFAVEKLDVNGNTQHNAITATAFAATPSLCTVGSVPRGVDASGNPVDCELTTLGTAVILAPTGDQSITGQHALWNQGRTWLGPDGNANHTFGLSPDSYLFNIEQDSTGGTTYPNPSVIMGVVGGLTPVADHANLFGNSTVVRDFASAFNVDSLGAIGGSSFWFGTSGKTLAFGYGVIGASYPDGAGNVGENWGVRGLATPGSAPFTYTGTTNHNKGGTFGSGGFSGTINNDYTVFIELPATGATFTNPHEGLHLEDQTAGGILANAYGIHELGSALNDLGSGQTSVGSLQSSGNINFATDNINDIGFVSSGRPRRVYASTDFVGPIGQTAPAPAIFTNLTVTAIAGGGVQCLQANNSGQVSLSGDVCGAGGGGGSVTTVVGTTNQIDVATASSTPTLTISSTFTFPGTVSNDLSIFGSTTSAQLRGVLSDETGTGVAVFANTPTLITPVLGVATATSINKITLTAPTTAATIIFGTDSATITFQGTDTYVGRATTDTLTHKTFDTAGTGNSFSINGVAATANTGTGAVARATSPTFVTPVLGAATGTSLALGGGTALATTNQSGTGNLVLVTGATLITPTLGVASATTINKVTLTAPATGSTLTIANGKTLTMSNTLTFTGTDSSSVAFGTGGTVAYTANNLSVFAATTSAQLAGVLSDETGTGVAVFATSPTIVTPTIASFINATHTHLNAAGGGLLDGSAISTGTVAAARIPWGTPGTIGAPMLDPRSPLFNDSGYICTGVSGTDGATHGTNCWQNAEAYMQAHGGTVVCPGDTTWTLNRVLVNNNDTFEGIGNQNPTLTCTIHVSVDAAFVAANPALGNLSTGWTGAVLSGVTWRNMYFTGGVNPIDITLGNQETYENLQFRDSSGCGISHVTGERVIVSNISSGHLSVNGFATLCTGDQTKSLFTASLSGGTALGLARSKFDSIFEGGASPTHYSQWAWFGGTLANGGNIGESVVNRVGCFFSCSVGVMQFGGGTNDLFDGLYMDSIADGLSAAPVGFNFVGEYDGVRWSGIDFGNSGGNTTTQMFIQTCTACTVQNAWFSQGVDNSATFGLKLGSTFGGSLVGVRGGVFAANPGSITAIGSYNLTPSNLRAGSGSFGPQIVDQNNTDSYYGLCNAFCASADTATAHFYRSTGSGSFADDLALSSTAATFTHKVTTAASTTTAAGLIVPPGTAPTSPVNGDIWTTTTGLFARINGTTVGPFGTGGSTSWNGITSPTGNQTLTMTGDSSTWNWGSTNTNQFAFDTSGNPTLGLVSATTAVTNSPTFKILGSYQNAGTPTFAADSWSIQDVVGASTNGGSVLTFSHSGSTGAGSGLGVPYVTFPTLAVSNIALSNNGNLATGDLTIARTSGIGEIWFGDAIGQFTFGANGGDATRFGLNGGISVPAAKAFSFTSANINDNSDTGLSRDAATVIDVGNGTPGDTSGKLKAAAYISVGTKFTTNNGCGETTNLVGGASAGTIHTSGSTSCTTVVTMGNTATAPNGWACFAHDLTTSADYNNPHVSSSATTATILSGTIVSGDIIEFGCVGY